MVRPVIQNASKAAELIGSLEQTNMNIRCPDGGNGGSDRLKFSHSGEWALHRCSCASVEYQSLREKKVCVGSAPAPTLGPNVQPPLPCCRT